MFFIKKCDQFTCRYSHQFSEHLVSKELDEACSLFIASVLISLISIKLSKGPEFEPRGTPEPDIFNIVINP